jgi:hypothetical protein
MAETLLTKIKRSDTFPYMVKVTANTNSGYISIMTDNWTPQMFYELPSIKFDIYVDENSVKSKYNPISINLDTYTGDIVDEKICSRILNVPENCYIYITPLFDNNAIAARNMLIENGIEEGTLWDTKTDTFPIDIVFDDSSASSGGGGGGGGGGSTPVLITKTITANGDYYAVNDNADGYSSVSVNVPPSGSAILHGSTSPTSSQGNENDIYLKTSNIVVESVTFAKPTHIQVDYYVNQNSVVEFDCSLPAPSNYYDTPWGSRGNVDHCIAYNGGTLRYMWSGANANIGSIAAYYDQRLKITLSRTNAKVETSDGTVLYDIDINGGTTTSNVKLGFFSLLTNNTGGDMGETESNGTFYGCKIYESGQLVRNYIPYNFNGTYCIKDVLTNIVYLPYDGNITGTETTGDDYVEDVFIKKDSGWIQTIGTPLNDIINE